MVLTVSEDAAIKSAFPLIFKPIYLLHAPHDNVRVALIARRAVVVETVAELPVAADEVGGLDVDVGRRVVRARTRARDLRARYVDVAILRVVHNTAPCGIHGETTTREATTPLRL